MLFKTIYGPELESLYSFIEMYGPQEKDTLFRYYLTPNQGESGKTNIEDALTFLVSSRMLKKRMGKYYVSEKTNCFKLQLLSNLRSIQKGELDSSNPLDQWYLEFLDILFIKPNRTVVFQLHQCFNTCGAPGMISEEKVNAWKRFMECIGVGWRAFGGFYTFYRPELLLEIIQDWPEKEGPFQFFLDNHLEKYLPWQTAQGDIASALTNTLSYLEKTGNIILSTRQDLPQRSYLGNRQVKWISKGAIE